MLLLLSIIISRLGSSISSFHGLLTLWALRCCFIIALSYTMLWSVSSSMNLYTRYASTHRTRDTQTCFIISCDPDFDPMTHIHELKIHQFAKTSQSFGAWSCTRYSCPLSPIFHHPLKFVNRLTTRITQQLLDVRQAVGLSSEHPSSSTLPQD